jgi:hypothetical protein
MIYLVAFRRRSGPAFLSNPQRTIRSSKKVNSKNECNADRTIQLSTFNLEPLSHSFLEKSEFE